MNTAMRCRRIAGDVSSIIPRYATLDQVMVSSVNFVTAILLARTLGMSSFGQFVLLNTIVMLLRAAQLSAIILPMLSIGPKYEGALARAYYQTTFSVQVIASGVASALIVIIFVAVDSLFANYKLGQASLSIAPAVFFVQMQEFTRRYFFAKSDLRSAFMNDGIRYGGQLAILVAIHLADASRLSATVVFLVLAATSALAQLHAVIRIRPEIRTPSLSMQLVCRNWRMSRWGLLAAVVDYAVCQVFLVGSGALLGAAAMGAIRAAETLASVTNVLLLAIENTMIGRAAILIHYDGKESFISYMVKMGAGVMAIVAGVCVVLCVAPSFWMTTVYGADFGEYSYLLYAFSLIGLINALNQLLKISLQSLEYTLPFLISTVIRSVVSISASYRLIEIFGLVGAAAGMIIVVMIDSVVASTMLAMRLRKLPSSSRGRPTRAALSLSDVTSPLG